MPARPVMTCWATMYVMTANEDWARLAAAVKDRRTELRMTQQDVQDAGGPSSAKIREIENQRTSSFSTSKRRDLERVLRWAPGSVDATLHGDDPVPLERLEADPDQAPPLRPDLAPWPDPSNRLDTRVIEAMMAAARGQISPEVAAQIQDDWTIDRQPEVFAALSRANKLRVAEFTSVVYIEQSHGLEPGCLAEVHYSPFDPNDRRYIPEKETPDDVTTEPTPASRASETPEGQNNGAADRRRLSKAPDLPSDDQAADVEPPAYPPSGLAVAANEGGPKGIETPPGEDEYSQDPDDHQE